MKSKVVNTLKVSGKTKTKHRKLGLVLFAIALTTIIIRALNQQYNNRRANEAKALIRDVRSLKTELEQKFNISLKEDVNCTQSQGKSSNRNSAWGCHVYIVTHVSGTEVVEQYKEYLKTKKYFVLPFKGSANPKDVSYYYKKNTGPTCGTTSNNEGSLISLYCGFSINNAASEEVFKELGISRPASNND